MNIETFIVNENFLQTLITVISPIIIGAFSTHALSKSWQNHKHKITLKQELINLYNESVFSLKIKQTMTVNDIAESVSDNLETHDELLENFQVESKMNFPEDPSKDLEEKFMPNYQKLLKIAEDSAIRRSLFKTRLELYTKDKSIMKDLDNITKLNFQHRVLIQNLIKSKDKEEFKKTIDKINQISIKSSERSTEFMRKLIKVKIKNISV